jgi:hypothetical protein
MNVAFNFIHVPSKNLKKQNFDQIFKVMKKCTIIPTWIWLA